MVQLRVQSNKWMPNDYWKLDSGDYSKGVLLRLLGNSHHKRSTAEELRKHHIRLQRGLPSYNATSLQELKQFCAQRRLPAPPGRSTAKALREQLIEADENMTFDRFSDLPPELRKSIYEYYFRSFGFTHNSSLSKTMEGEIQCQPPITLSCRLTRTESLPLFYSNCEFSIIFDVDLQRPDDAYKSCELDPKTRNFINNISDEDFARIQIFILVIVSQLDASIVSIDLDNHGSPVVATCALPDSEILTTQQTVDSHNRLIQNLNSTTKDIAARPKPAGRLRKEDIATMRDAFEVMFTELFPGEG